MARSSDSSGSVRCQQGGVGSSNGHKSSESANNCEHYPLDTSTNAKKRKPTCNAVAAKTSIKYLHDAVSRFNTDKRDMVTEIGFGGFLKFPALRHINRRFALWLMSRVDPTRLALVFDGGKRINFDKDDVHRVFGIPCKGFKVAINEQPRNEIVSKVMKWFGCTSFKEHRSVRAVQEIIEHEYNSPMSIEEGNAFKVAFVIYVISTVLSPGAKYDYPAVDYWDALIDPHGIKKYDWSDYVIRKLFNSVVKLQSDLKNKRKIATVTGCCLFLQVLYLDSIDTGPLNLDHKYLPRIKDFRNGVMESMILLDTFGEFDSDADVQFGQRKLRPCEKVCYSWALAIRGDLMSLEPPDQSVLWDEAVTMSQWIIGSSEAAGPVYYYLLDSHIVSKTVEKFDNKVMHGASGLFSKYRHGFKYTIGSQEPAFWSVSSGCYHCASSVDRVTFVDLDPVSRRCHVCGVSYQGIPRASIYDSPNASFLLLDGNLAKFLKESSLLMFVQCMGIRAMSRYFFGLRASKFDRVLDLNYYGHVNELEIDFIPKVITSSYKPVITPWELGLSDLVDDLDMNLAEEVEKRIIECHMDSKKCVTHNVPKYIEVTVSSIKMYMTGKAEMELDLFDAYIRCFKKIDDDLYAGKTCQRWRHFFESDFLGNVLAGYFDINDRSTQCQLLGRHLDYDITKCRMLLFPGLMDDRWVCYAWSLCDNTITVFDPITTRAGFDHHDKLHKRVASAIATAMDEVACNLFNGWRHNWNHARVNMYRISFPFQECVNRTAELCAMFCLTFDGIDDDSNNLISTSEVARRKMCALISLMSSNYGLFAELFT